MKTIDLTSKLNIMPVDDYQELLAPECIYIPISNDSKLFIDIPSKVLKDDLIATRDGVNYFSSISGEATGTVELNQQKYLKIINNYLEDSTLKTHSRHLNSLTKESFTEILNDNNLSNILNKDIKTLYIDCIDDEPYIFNNYIFLNNNMDIVLKTCKVLLKIFSYEKIVLVIKQNYQNLINKYIVTISEYGSIEMISVPNIYPIGNIELLKNTISHQKNDEFIYLNDLIKIIYKVRKNKIRDTVFITINGNNVKNPTVFQVKKYQLLSDVFKNIEVINSNYNIYLNNSLCGELLSNLDIIIDDNIKGVILMEKDDCIPLDCNNCGYCYDVCPMKINPLVNSEKCIKCGLCNYVCPMKINIVKRYQEDEQNKEC